MDTDIQIREGKNLLGVSYDVDTTDVVTRIMPTGEDKDGNTLYLPEVFIDSPYVNEYTHPKWVHLAVLRSGQLHRQAQRAGHRGGHGGYRGRSAEGRAQDDGGQGEQQGHLLSRG